MSQILKQYFFNKYFGVSNRVGISLSVIFRELAKLKVEEKHKEIACEIQRKCDNGVCSDFIDGIALSHLSLLSHVE